MHSRRFVSYFRVSTKQQGESGLGLEAQRHAVAQFIRDEDDLLAEFIEIESGKKKERPELERALTLCRQTGATLIIAKLDRLARNVAFVSSLMESGTEFIACDNPTANRLTIHILAAVAEDEARRISERTKAALQAAKARGVKLGGDRGYRPEGRPDGALKALKAQSDNFAQSVLPIIDEIKSAGQTSLRAIAEELNARGIKTQRGGKWHASTVRNALSRSELTASK
ncbi:recombinase family protein [Pseudovibrio ascidiaceicola]|uniref:recombinase family protein n=1 Tax=Pseudovibrio ascidiaceicola TaxID=285279 RepID=UPI000D68CFC8|nr:recombinase family protein [Pseudovibrio ascidiaceicola]